MTNKNTRRGNTQINGVGQVLPNNNSSSRITLCQIYSYAIM